MDVLVIVDVQGGTPTPRETPAWLAASQAVRDRVQMDVARQWSRMVDRVCEEVGLARIRRDAVVVLEHLPHPSRTTPAVLRALAGYPFLCVLKDAADGSAAVLAAVDVYGLPVRRLRVCGAMRHDCIAATAVGLVAAYGADRVEVIDDALFP